MRLIDATRHFAKAVGALRFPPPVAYVCNPLQYAWEAHAEYLRRYASGPRPVLFLGMNPGPYGMAQTGVPFGEVRAVRDWLGIECALARPPLEHPAKPIQGFHCPRSEVSGRRLWGLFAARFGSPKKFFRRHFVHNYCPLLFLENTPSGRNLAPDRLPESATKDLYRLCDEFLELLVTELRVEWSIGVGSFAEARLRRLFGQRLKIGKILHPSPASPVANRDWAGAATRQLEQLDVWPRRQEDR